MNNKQIELIRKRNAELSKQIDDLKFRIDFDSELNTESYKQAKKLISDLENLKSRWLKSIEEIEKEKDEYSKLISELKTIIKIMKDMGFKIPLYRKILLHFQSKKEDE